VLQASKVYLLENRDLSYFQGIRGGNWIIIPRFHLGRILISIAFLVILPSGVPEHLAPPPGVLLDGSPKAG
jgi:hypothetical protein